MGGRCLFCGSVLVALASAATGGSATGQQGWRQLLRSPRRVVYAFAPGWMSADKAYLGYDWERLTDLCLFGGNFSLDNETRGRLADIMSIAHQHQVAVSTKVDIPVGELQSTEQRRQWVADVVATVQEHDLDGVNVDFEDPIGKEDVKNQDLLTSLLRELRAALDGGGRPQTQLSFDGAWSPLGIDNRFYDLKSIASIVDLVFVMMYDTQSQIWDEKDCTARANAPMAKVREGLGQYMTSLGVSSSKLVLGLPWYGYDYPCTQVEEGYTCQIKPVPFRGAPCSDAAGRQVALKDIWNSFLPQANGTMHYDEESVSYFLMLYLQDGVNKTIARKVVFDTPKTLCFKYAYASQQGLAGVGFWNIDTIPYSGGGNETALRNEMFAALDCFPKPLDVVM